MLEREYRHVVGEVLDESLRFPFFFASSLVRTSPLAVIKVVVFLDFREGAPVRPN